MSSYSLKTIGQNTLAQLVVKGISSISTLAATIFISHFLGLSVFGSFTKIVTFVSFFYLLADFGINAVFLKDYQDSSESYFGNIISLRIYLGIILALTAVLFAFFLPYSIFYDIGYSQKEKLGILIYAITIITTATAFSFNIYYQKKLLYTKTVIPNLLASAVFLVFLLWGIFASNIFVILLGYALSGIILCLLLYKNIKQRYAFKRQTTSFGKFSRRILLSALPIGAMLTLNLIYAKADIIILSFIKPTGDVGIYGFAYRIFEFMIAAPAFFSNAVYPILINTHTQKNQFLTLSRNYSLILLLAGILTAFLSYMLAPLIPIVAPQFAQAVFPLKVLSLSLPLFFLTSLFQWVMIIENKKMLLVKVYAATMIINIALNLLFIPRYSYYASAVITVITEGIVFIVLTIYLALHTAKNLRNEGYE